MNNSDTTTKRNKVGSGVLIRQQITNAYNEFLTMVEAAISGQNAENEPVRVILFKDGFPSETSELEIEASIIYVKCNFLRSVLYYDPKTLTFRSRGTIYSSADFSFTNRALEKNRQILEIVHAMYILKYAGVTKRELGPLIQKYKYLTADMDINSSIDLSEIIVGELDETAYVMDDDCTDDIDYADLMDSEDSTERLLKATENEYVSR